MPRTRVVTDGQWAGTFGMMPCSDGKRASLFVITRRSRRAIVFRYRTGVAWRDLPGDFGTWQTVWKRHRRLPGDGT